MAGCEEHLSVFRSGDWMIWVEKQVGKCERNLLYTLITLTGLRAVPRNVLGHDVLEYAVRSVGSITRHECLELRTLGLRQRCQAPELRVSAEGRAQRRLVSATMRPENNRFAVPIRGTKHARMTGLPKW